MIETNSSSKQEGDNDEKEFLPRCPVDHLHPGMRHHGHCSRFPSLRRHGPRRQGTLLEYPHLVRLHHARRHRSSSRLALEVAQGRCTPAWKRQELILIDMTLLWKYTSICF